MVHFYSNIPTHCSHWRSRKLMETENVKLRLCLAGLIYRWWWHQQETFFLLWLCFYICSNKRVSFGNDMEIYLLSYWLWSLSLTWAIRKEIFESGYYESLIINFNYLVKASIKSYLNEILIITLHSYMPHVKTFNCGCRKRRLAIIIS